MSDRDVPAWRIGAGLGVLAALSLLGVLLAPVYFHNFELERYLRDTRPPSDEMLRQAILSKGRSLGLDIVPNQLQIRHSPTNAHIDVRYVVQVSLSLYTVDLHFSSSISAAGR